MNKFLLALFVFINIMWYDVRIELNAAYMYVTNLILKFVSYILHKTKTFLLWISWPFRKALYEYPVIIFFICLFLTIIYPEWKWTDYTWLIFFFALMTTLFISTIKKD